MTLELLTIAATAGIGVMILLAAVLLLWRRLRVGGSELVQLRREHSELQASIERVQRDFRALLAGSTGMAEHMVRLEQQLRRVVERQEALEMRDTGTQSYEHAIRMARSGASAEELMSRCGLVRDEAELMIRMYRLEAAS